MDYAAMLKFHADSLADVTIACMEVPLADADPCGRLGNIEAIFVVCRQNVARRDLCHAGGHFRTGSTEVELHHIASDQQPTVFQSL